MSELEFSSLALAALMAMSNDKTFHLYSWQDIAGDELVVTPNGETAGD